MKALITGASGQDGSYLSELLLEKGYEVHACVRHTSIVTSPRLLEIAKNKNFKIHILDLNDTLNLLNLLKQINPDEIYNLAAQSHVKISYSLPEYTGNTNALGTLRILDALKNLNMYQNVKFYQASTSELFGNSNTEVQSEQTKFAPISPYGIAKLYAYWMTVHHRNAYGMFASNGILFNHESPRRPENFVSRKISNGVSKIYRGESELITLGNLDAKRDWGHSKDYVRAMFLILQHKLPDDFVIATGGSRSVRDFVERAFQVTNVEIVWEGAGENEIGIDKKSGKIRVAVDSNFFRPGIEVPLRGDSSKALSMLGWSPEISFDNLVEEMVRSDLNGSKY